MKAAEFFKSVFSEADGTGSASRILIALLVVFVVGAGASFAVAIHVHKLTINDFNSFLSAAGTFLVTTTSPLYGINKLTDAYKNKQQGN
jgi:hypothetical protein